MKCLRILWDTLDMSDECDGKIYAWGDNAAGQIGDNTKLGDDTTNSRLSPVATIMTGELARKVVSGIFAKGASHSLVLTSDGNVYAWGLNNKGQFGDGTTDTRLSPVAVRMTGELAGKNVSSIFAGEFHSLLLTSDGKVYAWGDNNFGQLGDGTTTQQLLPVAVNMTGELAGKIITSISAGAYYSLALTSDKKVYSWGQLGEGTTIQTLSPVAVNIAMISTTENWVLPSLTSGGYHSGFLVGRCSEGYSGIYCEYPSCCKLHFNYDDPYSWL